MEKISPNLYTWDTVLVSNIGRNVNIPPFWASFLLTWNFKEPFTSEKFYADTLGKLKSIIQFVDLNAIFQLACTGDCHSSCPSDAHYNTQQFGLHDDEYELHTYSHINAEPGWQIETGKSFVKVGVFDSGIDWRHEDFKKNPLIDQSSKVIAGYDYERNSNLRLNFADPDLDGHGSKVAGIIGALRNQSVGIAGVAGGDWCDNPNDQQSGVSLYSFQVGSLLDGKAQVNADHLLKAMNDAFVSSDPMITFKNMDIGNFSLQGGLAVQALKQEFYTAFRLGKTLIAARGNVILEDPKSTPTSEVFPACFNDDWVISVGGSTREGLDAQGAMYGKEMDCIAPFISGLNYSLSAGFNEQDARNVYTNTGNGTSFSAGYVSGLAGLLLSYLNNPIDPHDFANLAPEDVEEIIQRTTSRTANSSWPYDEPYWPVVGWGRVNMGDALSLVDKNYARLVHVDRSTIHSLHNNYDDLGEVTLSLADNVPGLTNPNIVKDKAYLADVIQVSLEYHPDNLLIQNDEIIVAIWPRSSSSTSYPMYRTDDDGNNWLDPYEKAYGCIPEPDEFYCDMAHSENTFIWGYYYRLRDIASPSTVIGWLPFNPYTEPEKMDHPYSVLIHKELITSNIDASTGFYSSVYPNPASNGFHLKVSSSNLVKYSITLQNINGQNIRTLFDGVMQEIDEDYSTEELASGIYNVLIQSPERREVIKLCVINH